VRRETGKEQVVQVHYDEGVANVTQRNNLRAPIFFEEGDDALYRDAARRAMSQGLGGVLVVLPDAEPCAPDPGSGDGHGLARAIGETHRRYTGFVNARRAGSAPVPGRFASAVLDDEHLIQAARYMALNPVRARLVPTAGGLAVVEPADASRRPR
jgi:putative transposase